MAYGDRTVLEQVSARFDHGVDGDRRPLRMREVDPAGLPGRRGLRHLGKRQGRRRRPDPGRPGGVAVPAGVGAAATLAHPRHPGREPQGRSPRRHRRGAVAGSRAGRPRAHRGGSAPRPRDPARPGRRGTLRRGAGPGRAGARGPRPPSLRAPRRAHGTPRRRDRSGAPGHDAMAGRAFDGRRGGAPAGGGPSRRPGALPARFLARPATAAPPPSTPRTVGASERHRTPPRSGPRASRPRGRTVQGSRGGRRARRPVGRLRRRADSHRRLADHPCLRTATVAVPDGRHRRRTRVRAGAARLPVPRAARLPRRRAADARRASGSGVRRAGPAGARPARPAPRRRARLRRRRRRCPRGRAAPGAAAAVDRRPGRRRGDRVRRSRHSGRGTRGRGDPERRRRRGSGRPVARGAGRAGVRPGPRRALGPRRGRGGGDAPAGRLAGGPRGLGRRGPTPASR